MNVPLQPIKLWRVYRTDYIRVGPTKTIHGWRVPKLHFICCMYIVYDTAIAGSNRNSACNDDTQWSGGNWSTFISGEKPQNISFFRFMFTQYTFSANVRHLTEAAETKVLGRFCWRPIFTIENCLRNYWKLPSTFALIDVSLNSGAR